jgi:hypothetical protein
MPLTCGFTGIALPLVSTRHRWFPISCEHGVSIHPYDPSDGKRMAALRRMSRGRDLALKSATQGTWWVEKCSSSDTKLSGR